MSRAGPEAAQMSSPGFLLRFMYWQWLA